MMSIEMDRGADALLQAAHETSLDGPYEQYGVEIPGDGESSLSEIEDEDEEQDGDGDLSEELSNNSGEENDSEAETERLEESPHKPRPHQDVVLSSNNNQTYERSPSKLQNQITADDPDDEDDEPLSEGDLSSNESPDSPSFAQDEVDQAPNTANTSIEDSTIENKAALSIKEADTRKRKRSIFGSSAIDDPDEPLRKRTGSVITAGDDYAIEDDVNPDDEVDSNSISGNISGDEGGVVQEENLPKELNEPATAKEDLPELPETPNSPKRRGRKKKKLSENDIGASEDGPDVAMEGEAINGDDEPHNAEEETAENEGDDEAEIALRNEEELEKKRVALDQLGIIEKQFATFRERLYEERLEQLNREEAMLRQDKPTHPEYLAMMQCIEARRTERVRVADKLHEYGMQTLKNYAVARRSQILVQYQQEVREIRETELEKLGEQWYKIQHDRRSYAGSIPDYALKFPTNRSQQVRNQVAYSNEVSILAGVAKYVGFPAAPPMAAATAAELEEDLEKMGRTKHVNQPVAALPLQELAALRAVSSTSRFKPAEEQFIEQTPWANPQHPSHAHLLQRQTSAQQPTRTTSPFSQVQGPTRRHSHQQNSGPVPGTFSNSAPSLLHHSNGLSTSTGRVSPHNPFGNSHTHTIAPSPLGSRQPSLSPQQTRPPSNLQEQHVIQEVQKSNGIQPSPLGELTDVPRDFPHEIRREQAAAVMTRL